MKVGKLLSAFMMVAGFSVLCAHSNNKQNKAKRPKKNNNEGRLLIPCAKSHSNGATTIESKKKTSTRESLLVSGKSSTTENEKIIVDTQKNGRKNKQHDTPPHSQPNRYSNGDVDGGDDDDIQNGYTIPSAIIFSSEPPHCNGGIKALARCAQKIT